MLNRHLSQTLRRFLWIFLPVLALAALVALYFARDGQAQQLKSLSEQEGSRLAVANQVIRQEFFEVYADTTALASTSLLRSYLAQPSPDKQQQVSQVFEAFAETYQRYASIRIVNEKGMELVRVNYAQGRTSRVPAAQLRDLSDRPHVKAGQLLGPGEFHVSPLSRRTEANPSSDAVQAVIRFVRPVFDQAGTRRGLIILSYDASALEKKLHTANQSDPSVQNYFGADSTLLSRAGLILSGQGYSMAEALRKKLVFADVDAPAWQGIQAQEQGTVQTSKGMYVFQTVLPLAQIKSASPNTFDRGQVSDYSWKVVRLIPAKSIAQLSFLRSTDGQILLLLSLVLLGLACYLIAEYSTQSRLHQEEHLHSLQAREAEFRSVIEATPDGILVTDGQGLIVQANAQIEQIFGYSRSELLGQSIEFLVPDNVRGHHSHYRESYQAHPEPRRMGIGTNKREIHGKHKDGHLVPIAVSLNRIKAAQGQLIIASVTDITDLKQQEKLLRESDERFRLLASSIQDYALCMLNPEGQVVIWNQGAEKIKGYTAEEVLGQPMAIFYTPEDRAAGVPEQLLQQAAQQGHAEQQGWRVRKDGSQFLADMHLTAMRDEQGQLKGFAKITRDITEQHDAELRLQQAKESAEVANQAKSDFLANMSHEIRTPLNAILGLSHLLSLSALNPEQRHHVDNLGSAGNGLLNIVNNVLDLSKIEAGELDLENIPFNPSQVIEDVYSLMLPQALGKGLVLQRLPEPAALPAMLLGDPVRLRQILLNLTSNAIKFTPAGSVSLGIAAVEVHTQGVAEFARLRIEVSDTGIGIGEAAQKTLFTPFTQADNSTTRRFGGTGLGLSIVKKLAALLGGTVGIRSQEGQGSTFWVELELPLSTPELDSQGTLLQQQQLEVIVADDDPEQLQSMLQMATTLGWRAEGVADGQALVNRVLERDAQGAPASFLIVDWRMPELDGLQALHALSERMDHERMPGTIVLTAEELARLQASEFAGEADSLLVKPLDMAKLFNQVHAAHVRRSGSYHQVLERTQLDIPGLQWLSGVRVLLVDDSELNLNVASKILEREGAVVHTAQNGAEALQWLQNHAPVDIVLMDVQMPVMDGNTAVRHIRADVRWQALPVVALTAGAMLSEREKSRDAGMDDYLTKPFNPAQMLRVIRKHVEQSRKQILPVKAVALAAEARAQAEWPEIAGIDTVAVRKRLNGNRDMFLKHLRQFLQEFDGYRQPSPLGPERDLQALRADLHKMAGNSGLLGAQDIARLASQAEVLIQSSPIPPQQELQTLLAQLAQQLQALSAAALPWRDEPASARVSAAVAPALDPQALDDLKTKLSLRKYSAVSAFAKLSSTLQAALGDEAFQALKQDMDKMDFAAVLGHLQRIEGERG